MTKAFPGFHSLTENWFRCPIQLLNAFPLIETRGELMVVLYILRHTVGFGEEEKKITLDEFMYGRKRRDRSRMDNGTGLARQTVLAGLQAAIDHGFIEVETDASDRARIKKTYRLVLKKQSRDTTSAVQKMDSSGLESGRRSEIDTLDRTKETTDSRPIGRDSNSTVEEKELPPHDAIGGAREVTDAGSENAGAQGKTRPAKRYLPDETDGRLMRALHACGGRKYFRNGEKARWTEISQGVISGSIPAEWLDNCINYADAKQPMAFANLMSWVLNHDKMIDWLQRQKPKHKKPGGTLITDGADFERLAEADLLHSEQGMETTYE